MVQIRFSGKGPVNIPADLCSDIPWQILNSPPGILTLVTREPAGRWDSCLRRLQVRVLQCLPGHANTDTDWEVMPLARYNSLGNGQPVRVGRSWMVAPPDTLNRHPASGENFIFMRPGWAFGDGCHPTTRGSVQALEYLHEHDLVRGRDVLDVGTGTGILGIIAGKMNARSVLCLDIDPESIRVARENIRQNGLETTVSVTNTPLQNLPQGKWNLALANLTISVMIRTFREIVKLLAPPGIVVMSGFKAANQEEISRLIHPCGFEVIRSEEQDGWITSIALQK